MNKEQSIEILKIELAKYAVKYPLLVGSLGPYISRHYDLGIGLGTVILNLQELDKYVEYLFMDKVK